ncbi:sulfotransferase domain-containing protein [Pontiella agarivorans]|uniref:Sulfotransferase n=1 Tax=Pontiella agarivorans TaxID=3038953 RepID=A0ABU5MU56_9BACT|nr:sulfotransferase domain-containing protein [Pontiella agarivorans]MDZ8117747.1 sulfotransferase [Pontiella agarivorans]
MVTTSLRRLGNAGLTALGNMRRSSYDLNRTIVLSGTGRGGTTWLAQLMTAVPGSLILWEQLHSATNPASLEYGFGRPRYLPVDFAGARETDYIEFMLKGGVLGTGLRSQLYFNPWNVIFFKRYIHKFVNANMLLPWMTHRFGIKLIYLVRHPCAVVSSQLRHSYGAWADHSKSKCFHESLFSRYPHLQDVYDRINTREESLAFDWAIQNYVPLKEGFKGITVFYEDLVDHPEQELGRIFDFLEMQMPAGVKRKITKPSKTAYKDSNNLKNGKADLAGWKKKLKPEQVEAVMDVVIQVGVDLYGSDARPVKRTLDP